MKFAVAVLACALAVANAQLNRGAYNNFDSTSGQYRPNQQSQYNRYQPFNKYQQYKSTTYKPFVSSTPFPTAAKAFASVSVTPASVKVPARVPVVPVQVPVVPVVSVAKAGYDARSAETIKSGYDISPDGTYNYYYETNNGIAAQAQGTPRNLGGNPPSIPDVVQGSFSWIAPEGNTVSVNYVADENGYQPQSNDLPVPPPVPPQIARALEYVAKYYKA